MSPLAKWLHYVCSLQRHRPFTSSDGPGIRGHGCKRRCAAVQHSATSTRGGSGSTQNYIPRKNKPPTKSLSHNTHWAQLLLLTGQGSGKPIQAFVEAIACCGTSRLNVPLPMT